MLLDIDYGDDFEPRFFRARLRGGVIRIPALNSDAVKA